MFTEQQLHTLHRIYSTEDGREFVYEIIGHMLTKNHQDILKSGKEYRDELVGFGNCLLELVDIFETSHVKLAQLKHTDAPDRI